MKEENVLYWLWLAGIFGSASKPMGKLMARYEDPFELYRMDEGEIERLEGLTATQKKKLCDKSLESSYAILRYCGPKGITLLTYGDAAYPERLRAIEDPPAVLYVLGTLPDLEHRLCIGMVGTRKMSEYGRHSAYTISYGLAAAGAVVVSGMALGVDGVSACGAMEGGGQTVAVLGCGLDKAYPREHATLMEEILRHGGAVISEYPPKEPPYPGNFPKRNRIISGLCQGLVIVEGARGSGSLITAEKAIAQGRDLFALPGKINESNSDGPNELIRNGANVALCAEDVLKKYEFIYQSCLSLDRMRMAHQRGSDMEEALSRYRVGMRTEGSGRRTAPAARGRTERVVEEPTAPAAPVAPAEASEKKPTRAPKKKVSRQYPSVAAGSKLSDEVAARTLAALDETTRQVYARLSEDTAVSPDALGLTDAPMSDIITSLTLLELCGLAVSQPGGLYKRR
ncbi:MAG: DNA-processing protein DprA [Clostridia bacterium]|nr:DNA-processing protein DprA [Clostridia bacterium]